MIDIFNYVFYNAALVKTRDLFQKYLYIYKKKKLKTPTNPKLFNSSEQRRTAMEFIYHTDLIN